MIDYYRGLTKKQVKAIDNERERLKVACKHCGRRKVIPVFLDRLLCDWCNQWIYRTPSLEFKYKMEEQMKGKIEMKYILKNINYGTYLKYKGGTKRYPIYKDEATRFTKKEVEEMRNKFKHPENWEVKEVRV